MNATIRITADSRAMVIQGSSTGENVTIEIVKTLRRKSASLSRTSVDVFNKMTVCKSRDPPSACDNTHFNQKFVSFGVN